jgi:predicted MPP superfamily phosphohydrolase
LLKLNLDKITFKKQRLISSIYGLIISSFIPKIIFVAVISVTYFSNHLFSSKESLIIVPLVGLLSGFCPFFIIVYGIFKTTYRFKVNEQIISFKKLPKSFDGLRIIQISDIHLGSFNYRYSIVEKGIEKINHLKPDYIFITGDLVNNYAWELRGWEDTFNKIHVKKGKYAILGNHDYGDYSKWNSASKKQKNFEAIKKFYQDINFTLLLNEAEIITKNGESIAIIGVENWGKPPFKQYGKLEQAIQKARTIPFKILLSHDPSHWSEEVIGKTDIALTLAGHTHGMQLGFQFKNFKWSPIKYIYKHWAGLYKIGEHYLYVNRGFGWLGFPGRIGMRPEITLIILRRK